MNEVWIFNQQILVNVQKYIVDQNCDESINGSNWVRGYILGNIVRILWVHCQSLNQFNVMHTADECILTFSNTTAEPEHTYQCIYSGNEEKEFTKFH